MAIRSGMKAVDGPMVGVSTMASTEIKQIDHEDEQPVDKNLSNAVIARAFRDVALSLIGLFRIYNTPEDLEAATGLALRKLFKHHLRENKNSTQPNRNALYDLVDELNCVIDD